MLAREREVAQAALARGDKVGPYPQRPAFSPIHLRETDPRRHAALLLQGRALTALRQRKYQEQLLSRTDEQLSTLQGLVRRPVPFSPELASVPPAG